MRLEVREFVIHVCRNGYIVHRMVDFDAVLPPEEEKKTDWEKSYVASDHLELGHLITRLALEAKSAKKK